MENNEQNLPISPIQTEIPNNSTNLDNNNNITNSEIIQEEQENMESYNPSNETSEIVDLKKSGEDVDKPNSENKQHTENQDIIKKEEELINSSEKGNSSNQKMNYNPEQCGYCLICKCYEYGEISHNIVEDSEILKQSIGFSFVDDTSINSILAHRNYAEKEAIIKKYNDKYNKSLEKELSSHTHQKYRRTLVSILTEPSIYDTLNVENSIKTKSTNSLVEILLTRHNEQKELIRRVYLVKYGKNIEHEIVAKFSNGKSINGNMMKQLLIAMLNNQREFNNSSDHNETSLGNRNHSTQVDMNLVADDSNRLYQAGEHKKGTDHEVFIEILTQRSFAHLSKLDTFYQNANPKGHSLRRAIELEFSSKVLNQLRASMLDILLFSREPYKYWAEQFHRSLTSGWGVNELDLTRLTITQQYQASQIKQAYISHYDNSLITDISSKTSFRYKKIILSMLTV
ncbi:hypothetical protein RB653_001190 [Dictyostelium firmibasis]|uniref:Uncharacterized protein n=1 Tax=Dictyostelium firmibasis TaxID=79012 RepID=A0AAN7YV16_9MYCE